jgi:hypothetical protein
MRGTGAAALLLCFPVALAALSLDAAGRRARREGDQPAIEAAARLLPAPDLALAGGGRHLRFLALEEPGAAFADQPASLDAEPAGGAVAPPIEVFREIAARRARP